MPQEYRVPLPYGAVLVVRISDESPINTLSSIRQRLDAPAPFWGWVGQIMRRSFADNFRQGGRPEGWTPLAESTVKKKARLLRRGLIPKKTPTGRMPRRLMQGGVFGPDTILIERGDYRDSWVQKGARGHYEAMEGERFFIGSQFTIERNVTLATVRPYHILTKKGAAILSKQGELKKRPGTRAALIPLAVFHEFGTRHMPARRVGVVQEEDLRRIEQAGRAWVLGEEWRP